MTPRPDRTIPRLLAGGLAGLLAGAAGVTVSEAVSALLGGVTSPLLAVANRAVDAAPRPVKEWAIETFGSADKTVLIAGVISTVAVLAIAAGVVGVRRPGVGIGAFGVLSLIAAAAALTDRAATASAGARLLPVVALAVVGIGALTVLLRT
ncbi:MAG TPA: oxidoreductase, partial [Nocardioidaceae bacterium]|nr:oxidoreductase [Nocardioidaceae bacterium]